MRRCTLIKKMTSHFQIALTVCSECPPKDGERYEDRIEECLQDFDGALEESMDVLIKA